VQSVVVALNCGESRASAGLLRQSTTSVLPTANHCGTGSPRSSACARKRGARVWAVLVVVSPLYTVLAYTGGSQRACVSAVYSLAGLGTCSRWEEWVAGP
jgi:hypothetical protein